MRSTPWPFKYSVGPTGGLVINADPAPIKPAEAASSVQYESLRDELRARGLRPTKPKRGKAGAAGSAVVTLDWKHRPSGVTKS